MEVKRNLIWILYAISLLTGFVAATDFFADVVPTDEAILWKFRRCLLMTWTTIALSLLFLKFADQSQRQYFAFPLALTVCALFGLAGIWFFY
jgi:hypothetical protein